LIKIFNINYDSDLLLKVAGHKDTKIKVQEDYEFDFALFSIRSQDIHENIDRDTPIYEMLLSEGKLYIYIYEEYEILDNILKLDKDKDYKFIISKPSLDNVVQINSLLEHGFVYHAVIENVDALFEITETLIEI
jgi:hypothetical protein